MSRVSWHKAVEFSKALVVCPKLSHPILLTEKDTSIHTRTHTYIYTTALTSKAI